MIRPASAFMGKVLDALERERVCRLPDAEKKLVEERDDLPTRWMLIRQIYMDRMHEIMEASRQDPKGMTDPYFVDWSKLFTPIEDLAWSDIRYMGLPFYPQFPVLNYFIDFACPSKRIGVELDGAAYHDRGKDKARDELLWQHGWRIFRVTGTEAHRTEPDRDTRPDDTERYEADYERWFLNSSGGVFLSIDSVYFGGRDRELAEQCLNTHRLVDFPILHKT